MNPGLMSQQISDRKEEHVSTQKVLVKATQDTQCTFFDIRGLLYHLFLPYSRTIILLCKNFIKLLDYLFKNKITSL